MYGLRVTMKNMHKIKMRISNLKKINQIQGLIIVKLTTRSNIRTYLEKMVMCNSRWTKSFKTQFHNNSNNNNSKSNSNNSNSQEDLLCNLSQNNNSNSKNHLISKWIEQEVETQTRVEVRTTALSEVKKCQLKAKGQTEHINHIECK